MNETSNVDLEEENKLPLPHNRKGILPILVINDSQR